MKHSAMLKFAVMMFAVLALYLGGCVEVNNPDVKPVDFQDPVRFVNFSNLAGSMVVTIDNATTSGTVNYLSATSYMSLPAGTRFFSFAYGGTTDTLRRPLTPNTKYTFYTIYEPTNGDTVRTYLLASDTRTFSGTVQFPAGHQLVRFWNMSSDTMPTVSGGLTFHLSYTLPDTTIADTSNTDPVAFGTSTSSYSAPTAQSPKYTIVGSAGDTLITPTAVGTGDGHFEVVFIGSKAASSWQSKVFKVD